MPIDELRSAYLDAYKKHDDATERARKITDQIRGIATTLADWRNVFVENGEDKFPPALRESGKPINAYEWPSIEDLKNALSRWHETKAKLLAAWGNIPESERVGLASPK